jgi:hypothetical protein
MKTLLLIFFIIIFIAGAYFWVWHHDYYWLFVGIIFGLFAFLRIKYWKL